MSETIAEMQMAVPFHEPGLVPYPDGFVRRYRDEGLWRGVSLPDELRAAAGVFAERTALVTPEVRWTYAELFDRADRFARGLLVATDLKPGEPIMFQMGNVAETVVAYLGVLAAGLRPVCTLPQHGAREIGLLAEHVGARATVVQGDNGKGETVAVASALHADGALPVVIVARGAAIGGTPTLDALLEAGRMAPSAPAVDPEQIALFQLSGGTTGLPKVAPRLHEEYVHNSRAWARALGWGTETRVLYPLPLMHNAGIALALQPALLSGASVVLSPTAQIPQLLDLIEAERPTVLPLMPPALVVRMLEEPRSATADLSSIVDLIVGGQALPENVSIRLRDELGIAVRQMFGMAEGMFLVTPDGAGEEVRHHSVGSPVSPADEVRIVEIAGDDEVAPGEIGEFCARGPYTIRGYYRAEQHNRDAFSADGFYRTGDLARAHVIDGVTVYSIEGRIKDVINRGVEKIHAEEVEEVLLRHRDIVDAALVAMPDPVLGERACAYLIVEPGASTPTVASIGGFLTEQGLAKYKLPERIEVVDRFPLSNVGKVSKKDLRERVAEALRAESAH
ncbi:AMP-binding protein [Tsukamurella sp. 8F]|uniref:(2,3-dihydroxybenzoyl)adenylate synthase n=1 Tax=unclassified Tsukamurella TaxID=2633480 RepID=UPI0023B96AF8|nr:MULTISPECIES: AMP-binding protein [unclassified Tsukamurella]MDF0531210.1 AMP-binding protein [Tsukamurella sp. 8J]MDF0588479.1 AMP-binding protein [Tsukamurella sp. 8F]